MTGGKGSTLRHAARRRHQPAARQPVHEPLPEALAADRTRRGVPGPRRLLCRRLRHPQPRTRGRGSGVDAAGDDPARAHPQRGEDLGSGCPARALRLPWLHVRPAPLPEGWPLVSGREPVEEERAAAQGQGQRPPGARQQGAMARGARPAEPPAARLVERTSATARACTAYRAVDNHVYDRVRHFLVRRHKVPSRGTEALPRRSWCSATLGVLRLRRVHLGAAAVCLDDEASRKAGCGKSARPV